MHRYPVSGVIQGLHAFMRKKLQKQEEGVYKHRHKWRGTQNNWMKQSVLNPFICRYLYELIPNYLSLQCGIVAKSFGSFTGD